MGMARPLRLESEGGIYHVLNRGNYRWDLFRGVKTRAAFLKCLGEVCDRTGWRIHAWAIMSNHYHLAVETPQPNLAEGMRWLQGTFAVRFNRLRGERGHLFQGRYKSLPVDPVDGLGPLCHYIHLNPVRAHLCTVEQLADWPWSSMGWLMDPKRRLPWFDPNGALMHAGRLADTPTGRRKYLEYLGWLAEDEPARKAQRFDQMSRGWSIGSREFATALMEEHRLALGKGRQLAAENRMTIEAVWEIDLQRLLERLGRKEADLAASGKSEDWKIAIAAALKVRTTVTNRWLATTLHLGNLFEVSRKVAAWMRNPEPRLCKKLHITTNPKT
jgi:REP element-mobilizing transposase RayT